MLHRLSVLTDIIPARAEELSDIKYSMQDIPLQLQTGEPQLRYKWMFVIADSTKPQRSDLVLSLHWAGFHHTSAGLAGKRNIFKAQSSHNYFFSFIPFIYKEKNLKVTGQMGCTDSKFQFYTIKYQSIRKNHCEFIFASADGVL